VSCRDSAIALPSHGLSGVLPASLSKLSSLTSVESACVRRVCVCVWLTIARATWTLPPRRLLDLSSNTIAGTLQAVSQLPLLV
jgi:hypothetical protein